MPLSYYILLGTQNVQRLYEVWWKSKGEVQMETAVKKFREVQMRVYDWAVARLLPSSDREKRQERVSEQIVTVLR